MHNDMRQKTKHVVVARLRRSYAKAGAIFKRKLPDQAITLLGYRPKSGS